MNSLLTTLNELTLDSLPARRERTPAPAKDAPRSTSFRDTLSSRQRTERSDRDQRTRETRATSKPDGHRTDPIERDDHAEPASSPTDADDVGADTATTDRGESEASRDAGDSTEAHTNESAAESQGESSQTGDALEREPGAADPLSGVAQAANLRATGLITPFATDSPVPIEGETAAAAELVLPAQPIAPASVTSDQQGPIAPLPLDSDAVATNVAAQVIPAGEIPVVSPINAERSGRGQESAPTGVSAATVGEGDATLTTPAAPTSEQRGTSHQSGDQLNQHDSDRSSSAALSRAAQVDDAVRLENATGRPATVATPGLAASTPGTTMNSLTDAATRADGGEASRSFLETKLASEQNPTTQRVVRGLTTMVNQRGGTMTMRLDPPELGNLRVQMTIARGVVSAQFDAATEQAHTILSKNLSALRTSLEQHGLTVERLTVQGPASSQQGAATEDASSEHHQGASPDADDHQPGSEDEDSRRESARQAFAEFAAFASEQAADDTPVTTTPQGPRS